MWSAVVAGSRQDKSASCTGPFSTFDKNYAPNSLYVLIMRIFVYEYNIFSYHNIVDAVGSL